MTTNDGDPPSPTTLGTKFEYSIDLPYDFDATSPDTQLIWSTLTSLLLKLPQIPL